MTGPRDGGAGRPKFLCDAMLGTLARWLRFFGFDAEFQQPGVPDELLAAQARDEGRWLLTRDRALAAVGPRTLLVRPEDLEGQLVEVLSRLGLRPEPTLERARCGECNGRLEDAAPAELQDAVPPYVLATAPRFKRCARCGRVYWPGSHGERMLARMRAVVQALSD